MELVDENKIRSFVDPNLSLSVNQWEQFFSIWRKVTFSRKQIISEYGATEKYLYFVLEGSQRVFYTDHEEKEATLIFTYPVSFGGNLDSFLLQSPAPYYYQALTKSTLLRASYADILQIRNSIPEINMFFEKSISFALQGLLERMTELQCFSSQEKFKALLKRSPHILQLIPNKYLANYIGVDPTNFSKFINSVPF